MQKLCPKCDTAKPLTNEFWSPRQYGSKDGFYGTCRDCELRRQRGRHAARRKAQTPPPAVDDFEIVVEADPVAEAYAARDTERAKRDLKKEHKALLDENEKLKRERLDYLKLGAPEIIVYDKAKHERSDSVANAIFSDWHVDEIVEKNAVHGLNEYNPDIAQSRAEHCFKNLLALTDTMAADTKITTIHVSLLGDFFSGWIHEELIAGTAFAPGDAAHFAEGLIASGVEFLLRESSYILEFDCIPGNHGRMTKQVHIGDPTGTSLETFMYRALANRFTSNPRVHMRVADHAMVYRRVYEKFVVRKIHGYEVKYGGGVGGVTVPLIKKLEKWDSAVKADLTELGHFHQFFPGRRFLGNGSLIGYNAFAQTIGASYEAPVQAFYLIHARNGGEQSVVAPIWLDNAHKASR